MCILMNLVQMVEKVNFVYLIMSPLLWGVKILELDNMCASIYNQVTKYWS